MQKGPFTAPPVISFLSWPLFCLSPRFFFLLYPTFAIFLRAVLSHLPLQPPPLFSPPKHSLRKEETVMKRMGRGCTCVCVCLYFSIENTQQYKENGIFEALSLPSLPWHRSVCPKYDPSPPFLLEVPSLQFSLPVPHLPTSVTTEL